MDWKGSMKNSRKKSKMLDLEKDLPTTLRDIEAQRRAKFLDMPGPGRYLEFLESMNLTVNNHDLSVRKGPRGDEPFELLV